jgi:hypothetical protein
VLSNSDYTSIALNDRISVSNELEWMCKEAVLSHIYRTVPALAGETGKTTEIAGFSVSWPKFEPVSFLIQARNFSV